LAFELGDGVDMGTLRRMTDQTGGRSYSIEDAHRGGEDLIDRAVAEIGAELREQYSLGYYPPPADGKPRFRRIQVKVADRAVRVRTRTGYWTGTPQQP
jgi:VWFA-related protein